MTEANSEISHQVGFTACMAKSYRQALHQALQKIAILRFFCAAKDSKSRTFGQAQAQKAEWSVDAAGRVVGAQAH
jgi:hypothetical protein